MNLQMIRAAAALLQGHARHTPLLAAPLLDRIAGRRVWVKAECLQWTGSFKFRGGWAAVSALPAGTQGVIAYSSGNPREGRGAGREPPWCALRDRDAFGRAQGEDRQHTRLWGRGGVVSPGEGRPRRDWAAMAAERGLALIKLFDSAEGIAVQGSIGLEIAQDFEGDDGEALVLTSCGGCGMTAGVALALKGRMQVRACEP